MATTSPIANHVLVFISIGILFWGVGAGTARKMLIIAFIFVVFRQYKITSAVICFLYGIYLGVYGFYKDGKETTHKAGWARTLVQLVILSDYYPNI